MKLAISILALASMCSAAPLPDAPSATKMPSNPWASPFKDAGFISASAFHLSGILKDQTFARSCVADKTCFEQNPRALSNWRIAGEWGLLTTADYGCRVMLYNHKWYRQLCSVPAVLFGVREWHDGTRIYRNGKP